MCQFKFHHANGKEDFCNQPNCAFFKGGYELAAKDVLPKLGFKD